MEIPAAVQMGDLTPTHLHMAMHGVADLSPHAQAVARFHRMNQMRQTQVIRFVVTDSIEAVLHQLNTSKFAKMDGQQREWHRASAASALRRRSVAV
jgi:hypothetical protein